jgi:hypothetical protein
MMLEAATAEPDATGEGRAAASKAASQASADDVVSRPARPNNAVRSSRWDRRTNQADWVSS